MTDPVFKGAAIFQIYVHDEDDRLVSLAADTTQPGTDRSYVQGKGRFYLTIRAANCKWKVSEEDQE